MLHVALLLPAALLLNAGAHPHPPLNAGAHPHPPLRAPPPRCAEDPLLVPGRVPRIAIEYCTRCNWMLRSAWLSQELLTTFNGTITEVALVPNHMGDGTFECTVISADGDNLVEQTVWDRTVDGGFPEAKELKQRVRDIVAPSMDLGHSGDQKKEEAPGTAKSALQRLLSVVRLDRGKRGDKR